MSIVLALDTATENCSVAVSVNGAITHLSELVNRGHTDKILPMLDRLLAQAGTTLQAVDAIAFGAGPGGFTGVRIGTAVAQGLAYAMDKPLLAVTTLDALAAQAVRCYPEHDAIVSAIDARMNEVYYRCYQIEYGKWLPCSEMRVAAPDTINETLTGRIIGIGSGWGSYQQALQARFPDVVTSIIAYPEAYDIVEIAAQRYLQGEEGVAAAQAQPCYVRNEVTWQKLPGRG